MLDGRVPTEEKENYQQEVADETLVTVYEEKQHNEDHALNEIEKNKAKIDEVMKLLQDLSS